MHVRTRSAPESNINVMPLVDVCLVLLIIFMVVLPPVAVRGDKKVEYGEVAGVLEACRDAGFHDVRLITTKR